MSELKCACKFEFCQLTEADMDFQYKLKDGSLTPLRKRWLSEQHCEIERALFERTKPKDYDAMDAEVQASGFVRKPSDKEFYIVFDKPLTQLERLQVGAAVFSALYVAFPNSHIGDYKGMI